MTEESNHLSDLRLAVGREWNPNHRPYRPEEFLELASVIMTECIKQGIGPISPVDVRDPMEVIAWLHWILCQCQDKTENE